MKLRVQKGLRYWHWACFPCSEGFAHRSWRVALEAALDHAHRPVPVDRRVKVRRGALGTWSWRCGICHAGADADLSVKWEAVVDSAHRHARRHREAA